MPTKPKDQATCGNKFTDRHGKKVSCEREPGHSGWHAIETKEYILSWA